MHWLLFYRKMINSRMPTSNPRYSAIDAQERSRVVMEHSTSLSKRIRKLLTFTISYLQASSIVSGHLTYFLCLESVVL